MAISNAIRDRAHLDREKCHHHLASAARKKKRRSLPGTECRFGIGVVAFWQLFIVVPYSVRARVALCVFLCARFYKAIFTRIGSFLIFYATIDRPFREAPPRELIRFYSSGSSVSSSTLKLSSRIKAGASCVAMRDLDAKNKIFSFALNFTIRCVKYYTNVFRSAKGFCTRCRVHIDPRCWSFGDLASIEERSKTLSRDTLTRENFALEYPPLFLHRGRQKTGGKRILFPKQL